MSISVTYYSFNKIKADKAWQKFFLADLQSIQKQLNVYEKEIDEIMLKLDAVRKNSALAGPEHLLQEFNDFADYDRGDTSKRSPEDPLRVRFHEILVLKKELAEKLGNDFFLIILRLFEDKVDETEIVRALIDEDLEVGSIQLVLEDPHLEQDFLKMIATLNDVDDLPFSTQILTEDWIGLMKQVTEKTLNEFLQPLISESKKAESRLDIQSITEFRAAFIDYISGVRQLVMDCERNGSVMVINQNGEELSYDGLPLQRATLQSRAVEHYKKICEYLTGQVGK